MRNKNKMSITAFVWENIYWAALILLPYRVVLFYPVFGLNAKLSMLVLAGMLVIGQLIGVLLTYKRRRNYVSVLTNVTLSYAAYFALSFWHINRVVLLTAAIAVAAVAVSYSLLVFVFYWQDRQQDRTSASEWFCFMACMINSRTLASVVLGILLLTMAAGQAAGLPMVEIPTSSKSGEMTEISPEETLRDNMDTLVRLEEEWEQLDRADRLSVMQTIADIEAKYLGIPAVRVCADVLPENVLGNYQDSRRLITLNVERLSTMDSWDMVEVVCHEAFHAYQFRLVEFYETLSPAQQKLWAFRGAAHYSQEFENYIDGQDDLKGYLSQWCETDSDAYAREAMEGYRFALYQYLEEESLKEGT